MNKHDAAVKGLILLTGVQSLLCLPILSPSTFTIYEQFTDLAVFITLFAFVICMSGSFALAKAECTSRKRRETIHTIATAAIVMLLGSLYCLNFDTMKSAPYSCASAGSITACSKVGCQRVNKDIFEAKFNFIQEEGASKIHEFRTLPLRLGLSCSRLCRRA